MSSNDVVCLAGQTDYRLLAGDRPGHRFKMTPNLSAFYESYSKLETVVPYQQGNVMNKAPFTNEQFIRISQKADWGLK